MPMIALINSGVYVHAFVANGYSKVVLERRRLLKGVDIDEAEIKEMILSVDHVEEVEERQMSLSVMDFDNA